MRNWLLAGAMLMTTVSAVHGEAVNTLTQSLAGRWALTHVGDVAVKKSGKPVGFAIEGTNISGFDGCNSFGGSLAEPNRIVGTQMACASGGPVLPLDLGNPLPQLQQARVEGNVLLVPVAGSPGKLARFVRSP
jgi:hypothetical protein